MLLTWQAVVEHLHVVGDVALHAAIDQRALVLEVAALLVVAQQLDAEQVLRVARQHVLHTVVARARRTAA